MFNCEFREIFKNNYFEKQLRTTVSEQIARNLSKSGNLERGKVETSPKLSEQLILRTADMVELL